jgi:hypothetical protein
MSTINRLPLFCSMTEDIFGNGFIARVSIRGRVLAETSDEGVWMNGVNPGSIAETGKTIFEAMANFRVAYRKVLIDFMKDAGGSQEIFEGSVRGFFEDCDVRTLAEWQAARDAIRSGEQSCPQDLQLTTEDIFSLEIVTLIPTVSQNVWPENPLVAA